MAGKNNANVGSTSKNIKTNKKYKNNNTKLGIITPDEIQYTNMIKEKTRKKKEFQLILYLTLYLKLQQDLALTSKKSLLLYRL